MFGRIILVEHLDEDVGELVYFDGYGAIVWSGAYSYMLWLVASLASYLGIFLFKRWGRDLLLFIYLLAILMSPFMGVMVNAPYETSLYTVMVLSDGIIIGLLCFAWSFEELRQGDLVSS